MSFLKHLRSPWPVLGMVLWLACGGDGAAEAVEQQAAQPAAQPAGNPQAPAFQLQTLEGQPVSLADIEGKVAIIDFWATWCPPCVKEIPEFIELYQAYRDQGLVILGISMDQAGPEVVRNFVAKNGVTYPVAMFNPEVVEAYEVFTGIPTTFILDRQGQVVQKVVGYHPKSFFESEIKKLL